MGINACSYLTDVLNFRNYIDIPENMKEYFYISNDELKSGRIKFREELFQTLKKWLPAKYKNTQDADINEDIDVLLIPKTVCDLIPAYNSAISVNKKEAWEYKKISLFYIKAKLNFKTLTLSCIKGESLIWADPIIKPLDENPIRRILSKLIKILLNNECADNAKFELKATPALSYDGDDWESYMEKVAESFRKRTGEDLYDSDSLADECNVKHFLYNEEMYGKTIVMKDDTVFATFNIVNLISGIRTYGKKLPLLETMLSGGSRQKTTFRYDESNLTDHVGQMKNEYPLANAQRVALHAFSTLAGGEVLAVSGPPGTGKTTMLQSIVADMIVKMTLSNRKEYGPDTSPLILATSANNKAITNIIDALSNSDENTSEIAFDKRWICYNSEGKERFVPMAVYMPSGSVDRHKIMNYFVSDYNGGGNYGALRQKYHKDSSDFLKRAGKVFGYEFKNLKAIIEALSKEIDSHYKSLHYYGTSRKTFEQLKIEILASHPEFSHLSQIEIAKNIDELLDLTLRYKLYWLSVHYNECQWLKRLESQNNDDSLKNVYGKFLFDEIKYICPCIISTFFMAPKLFSYKQKDGKIRHNYEFADLLIVDEAGQVSPEIGLPTFALAKKAVVIGDIRQIPPVHVVSESIDKDYWEKNMACKRCDDLWKLLSCSKSNIMAIAEKCCRYQREDVYKHKKDGLFLNEHRRCVDEIIDYSNQLIYDGELIPKTGPAINRCRLKTMPPMGILVNESDSKTRNGSRYNEDEIRAIRNFIKSKENEILDAYKKDCPNGKNPALKDLICIITPFKAQSSLIQKDEYLRQFPAGTVHTFQGAESPIVIFSMVYGEKDNPAFIKNNHELMNVAVSRAKHHFFAVGSRACIKKNNSDKACGLLYENLEILNG